MNLYRSDCYQKEQNKYFPHETSITSLDDLRDVACWDHMFSAVKNCIREHGRENFISCDGLVLDCDNEHSDDPDQWITPDDVSDAFENDVEFYIVYSRNHLREKHGKSPRPRFHLYCDLAQVFTNYDDLEAFARRICCWFPYFDRAVVSHPTQLIYGVRDPQVNRVDGDQTLDQFMQGISDDQLATKRDEWLNTFSRDEDTFDPGWLAGVRRFLGASEPDSYPEVEDPQLDTAERDRQCKWFKAWAADHGVQILREYPVSDKNHWQAVAFNVHCFQEELHTEQAQNESKIIIDAGPVPGRISYKCWHSHCDDVRWEDFRAAHDPEFALKRITRQVKLRRVQKKVNGQTVWVPVQSADNIAAVLRQDPELAGRIRFDCFSGRPRYEGQLPWRPGDDSSGNWTDSDDAFLSARLHTLYDLKGRDFYEDAMRMVLFENRYNPVVDYLESLPPWDGVDHISGLLPDYLGAERTPYNTAVMRLFMLEGLSRIYRPGCKADYVLVLVGEQGIGKSEFGRKLAVFDEWYDDHLDTIDGREAAERLRGKWILELSELLALKRAKEVEAVKAFVTAQVDSYREPYSKHTTDHPRFCIFIATTNEESFLSDRTGNRRFLPVKCMAQPPRLNLFDADARKVFDLAWAQALHEYRAADGHPSLVLPDEILAEAKAAQEAHLEEDPRVGIIQEYLDQTVLDRVCVMGIWREALHEQGQPSGRDSRQIHSIMRNDIRGWREAGQQRFSGYGQQRAYERVTDVPEGFKETGEEIPF